ncbi:MAG TPA: MlaD family protein, partial [Candidatus Sulfotelmatobacter sp.]|nr:MlaD family protein [Candidatus Sulfotelmatobacter sp.]
MSDTPEKRSELPRARVEKNWKTYLIWLVPVAAAGFAGWLVYTTVLASGPTLHIDFPNAEGMEKGNTQVKYRGAVIGSVEAMHLSQDHQSVEVEVSLDKSAADLAREGSVFWIVKPEVSLGQIRGLRTLVSGAYITVRPGGGKRQTHFKGLPEPPLLEQNEKGLKLVLLADKQGSLEKRAPVYYRDVQVGEVLDFAFNQQKNQLEVPIWIHAPYVSLVGTNSRFWNAGGLRMQMSLGGIEIHTESMKALISGGVAFSTPGGPQGEVKPGTQFQLHANPLPAWLGYAPTNAVGSRVSL